MKISEIKQAYYVDINKQGADGETWQAKYYARPLSFYAAWFFIKLGVSANVVSVLTLIAAIIGCALIATGDYWMILIGVIILNIGHVLDYTDGDIARATNTSSKFGQWLDRTIDEIVVAIIPISIGVACIRITWWFLIIGFVYAILHALSALSMAHTELAYGVQPHNYYRSKTGLWQHLYKVGNNLQSMATLLLIPFAIFNMLPYYLGYFAILTACELVVGILIRIIKR